LAEGTHSFSGSDRIRSIKEKKYFVIDTNVILHDPQSIFSFGDNIVVIPIRVIDEADKFKREMNEKGKNARTFSRLLDAMREFGNLADGVPLELAAKELTPNGRANHGGVLKVYVREIEPDLQKLLGPAGYGDVSILAMAMALKKEGKNVILVTKDVSFRVRADAFNVPCVDYNPDNKVSIEELDPGWRDLKVPTSELENFFKKRELESPSGMEIFPHEYFVLRDEQNEKNSALARFDPEMKRLVPIIELPKGLWGVMPRNKEQRFAIDMLMNEKIPLVTLCGKAGTGKTMLALAAGLTKVLEESSYTKMLVSRSIFPLGRDIGFLPGEMEEKLRPWMQPIFDNFEFLLSSKAGSGRDRRVSYKTIMDFGQVEIEALTYIRGRTLPHQYLVVDEAQNLTPHEIKTIITRVGEGTKIVLTGDPFQIDNPYIDASNNAVTFVAEKFKDSPLAAHMVMAKGERSALAEVASNIL
jgi:PhoH-like ATPase